MTRQIKLTTLGLVSALMINIATPLTAQAGTLTVFNKNCTTQQGFELEKWVKVHIDSKGGAGCTNKTLTVSKGQSKTVQLAANDKDGNTCGKYRHDAVGMLGNQQGKFDVDADEDASVTCINKILRSLSCQCIKD